MSSFETPDNNQNVFGNPADLFPVTPGGMDGMQESGMDFLPVTAHDGTSGNTEYGGYNGDSQPGYSDTPADTPAAGGGDIPPVPPTPPTGGHEFAENPDDRAILHVGDIQTYSLDDGLAEIENVAVVAQPIDIDDRIGQGSRGEIDPMQRHTPERIASEPHDLTVQSDSLATARGDTTTPITLTGTIAGTQLAFFHRPDTGEAGLVHVGTADAVGDSERLTDKLEDMLPTLFQQGVQVKVLGETGAPEHVQGSEFAGYLSTTYRRALGEVGAEALPAGTTVSLNIATGAYTITPPSDK